MKHLTRKTGVAAAVLAALLLAGCNKNEVHQGGEGTNFPYTWQVKNNGSVIVKLDGSYAPDYTWVVDEPGQTVVKVETIGNEKKGAISYRITPLAEGNAVVTFTRRKELSQDLIAQDMDQGSDYEAVRKAIGETVAESEATESETAESEAAESETAESKAAESETAESKTAESEAAESETAESEAAENETVESSIEEAPPVVIPKGDTPPAAGSMEVEHMPGGLVLSVGADSTVAVETNTINTETTTELTDSESTETLDENDTDWNTLYAERLTPHDVVSEIRIFFEVTPTGKKGKLCVAAQADYGVEYKGLTRSTDSSLDYKIWTDSMGSLMVRVPYAEKACEVSWEGEYLPETSGESGSAIELQKVDDRYEILTVSQLGAVGGDECFEIQGLASGRATVEFKTGQAKKLILEVAIAPNGEITVNSHHVEQE
ncbi:MAG: hypothetical protein J6M66_02145 [Lachnospiraceae bacterium]|nr:hypothetical protein [Lachnospiraceae bacterium]